MQHNPYLSYDEQHKKLHCEGDWDVGNLKVLSQTVKNIKVKPNKTITIDGGKLNKLDSAGAWFLSQYQTQLEHQNIQVDLINFKEHQLHLLQIVNSKISQDNIPAREKLGLVARTGKGTLKQLKEMTNYLSFVGLLSLEALRITLNVRHWRIPEVFQIIYQSGFLALPIIALLSFMIGVVITYQMGLQLINYGANIYIVDLLGLAILREFGPLLTAIMVAGRTGSSFTAQLGMMKINQEIDALNTMGITPAEILLLPRITGLFIALPLLTIWADVFGVLGGIVMSKVTLGITPYDFLTRFPQVIKLRNLFIGLGKAPIFALIIATVGCYEGMRVKTSAQSVGHNTTRSVVLSIFFIIVADALFSIIFSKLKL